MLCLIFSVKLKHFQKFEDTTEALSSAASLIEGKLCKSLKKVLMYMYIYFFYTLFSF